MYKQHISHTHSLLDQSCALTLDFISIIALYVARQDWLAHRYRGASTRSSSNILDESKHDRGASQQRRLTTQHFWTTLQSP
jgi:hypothetical protein